MMRAPKQSFRLTPALDSSIASDMKAQIAFLLLAAAAPVALAQCPKAIGVPEALPPTDNWAASRPIGFAFPFNGATYTDFYYSDHGLIALNNAGVPATPPNGSQLWDPGSQPNTSGQLGGGFAGFGANVICAYWGDHTFNTGTAYIDNTSGSSCTITWFNSEPFASYTAGQFTAQVTLYSDGSIVINLDSRCNNTSSTFGALTTVIGVHADGNPIPTESDLSTGAVVTANPTCFEEFTGPGPTSPNTPDPLFDLTSTSLTFLPLSPGWLVTTAPLACASASTVGTGCSGLSLASSTVPALGGTWTLTLSGIAAPAPFPNFMAIGSQVAPVPIGLVLPDLFGASCVAVQDSSAGIFDIGPATGGSATMNIAVPRTASLAGIALTMQGLSFNFPLGTPTFGLSNGVTGVLGF